MNTWTPFLLLASLGLAIPASPASAEEDNQQIDITFVGARPGVVVARGVIDAVGRATEATVFTGPTTFQGTLTFDFPDGDVVAAYSGSITGFEFDDRSCTGTFTTAGSFTISSGNGAYTDATGEGTYTEEGQFRNARTAAGGCSDEQVFRLLMTDGSGTVQLPIA